MKSKVVVVFFICACALSYAQENNQLNIMINESLLSYLNWKSEITSKTVKGSEDCIPNFYLDNYPDNFSVSDELLRKNVRLLSLHNLSGQRELLKNKEYKFIIPEILLENNHIRIKVLGKKVTISRRKQLHIEAVDWGVFTYAYSCNQQEWNLIGTIFGGV